MAPSPTIPTSFVPKQPVKTVVRRPESSTNVFTIFGLGLLVLSILAAAGVFGYQKYLESVRNADAVKLESAKAQISRTTVEDFIRTRDRFTSSKDILENHVVFSKYLDTLEGLTLQNVRFTSLHYTLSSDGTASIQMNGTARSFNALAAESNAFTGVKEFKRAIFSGIGVNDKDSTVTFVLTADIDKSLILTTAQEAAAAVSANASTTAPAAVSSSTPAKAGPTSSATTTP